MNCNRFRIFLFAACTMLAFGCGDSGNSGNTKAQPGGTNEQPGGNNEQPGGNNEQPGGNNEQPGGNNEQPVGNNEQPGGNNEQPGGIVSVQNRTVSGVSQKGPFVTGSTVTVQELNGESLLQTGISFKGKITNDKGEFKVASINLASQYALLEVNGYYRNEVTGQDSTSPIIMNALADISDREHVNINLLTHLEIDRVMHLVTVDGKSFGEAKNQAREELLGYFGIDGNFGAAEDMSIFGENEEAAALLAISIIAQGDLRESKFTERLAHISGDIADGTIDNEEIWQQMATGAMAQNLRGIRLNVENWGENVPEFEPYVKAFWRDRLGLGTCDKIGEVKQYEGNGISLVCRENGWDIAGVQDILNDRIGVCDKDGIVKYIDYIFDGYSGLNLDLDYYVYDIYPKMGYVICRNGQWESANIKETLNHELGACDEIGTEKTFCNYVEVAEKVESWFEYHELERGRYICGSSGWEYEGGSYYLCEVEWTCNNGICDPGEEEYCPQDCNGGELCGNGVCDSGEEKYCPQDCNGGNSCGACSEGDVECAGDDRIRKCVSDGGCAVWKYEDCPAAMKCADNECAPVCGDGIAMFAQGEECDEGANVGGEFVGGYGTYGGCNADCTRAAYCGDGNVDTPYEACDFGTTGNTGGYKGCNADCTWSNRCGDGVVDAPYEECDLGTAQNTGEYGGCNADCTLACMSGAIQCHGIILQTCINGEWSDEVCSAAPEHGQVTCDPTTGCGFECDSGYIAEGGSCVPE